MRRTIGFGSVSAIISGHQYAGDGWAENSYEDSKKYPKLPVVLVTAYMNYALDGYKVKASRFLLKDNLADTIEECMDDLIAEINKNRRILEFRFVEGTIKLYADDIIYIETELHKNVFILKKVRFRFIKNWMNWKMNSRIWDSCGHI